MRQLRQRQIPNVVRVWDPFVRIFHWTVVTAFFVAYLTEDDFLTLHVWAGYLVGGLVLLRILWGLIGPKHARFSDFVYPPTKVFRYAVGLISFRAERFLGHSPAGGAMILVLLAGLLLTVWSGFEVYAIKEKAGPLSAFSDKELSATSRTDGRVVLISENEHEEGEDGNGEGSELWEEVHEAAANFMLILVIAHVGGVLLGSMVHRENLVRSMVTGWKRNE